MRHYGTRKQKSQTAWKRERKREKTARKQRDIKSCPTEEIKSMIPSGDGDRESVKRWKQTEQKSHVCMCCDCTDFM